MSARSPWKFSAVTKISFNGPRSELKSDSGRCGICEVGVRGVARTTAFDGPAAFLVAMSDNFKNMGNAWHKVFTSVYCLAVQAEVPKLRTDHCEIESYRMTTSLVFITSSDTRRDKPCPGEANSPGPVRVEGSARRFRALMRAIRARHPHGSRYLSPVTLQITAQRLAEVDM